MALHLKVVSKCVLTFSSFFLSLWIIRIALKPKNGLKMSVIKVNEGGLTGNLAFGGVRRDALDVDCTGSVWWDLEGFVSEEAFDIVHKVALDL